MKSKSAIAIVHAMVGMCGMYNHYLECKHWMCVVGRVGIVHYFWCVHGGRTV